MFKISQVKKHMRWLYVKCCISSIKPVVLNLGGIEPQGFVESVSGDSAEVKNSKTIFNIDLQ